MTISQILTPRLAKLAQRAQGRYQRTLARTMFPRRVRMLNSGPLVSFTFDDFPRSALYEGGEILRRHGCVGTYYASFGLMGTHAPTGELFTAADLPFLLQRGHEIGCHTFSHPHSWVAARSEFEDSIDANARAANRLNLGIALCSFAYPISEPHPLNKRLASARFNSCRGGGQTHNTHEIDLGLLRSYFIEKSRDNPEQIFKAIDANGRAGGWLIFSTHDVSHRPTPYGCTPELFDRIVTKVLCSGARVLPIGEALRDVRGDTGSYPIA